MSLVLYRKYRSQTFDELIGQDHVTSILKNAVSQGQIAHAYLFHGPRGLGKTSTARILAKAVNCLQLQPSGNPCGKCDNCVAIQEGKFLDLIEIDAASNRGIDDIRELKEKINYSPSEGKYKVYAIDEAHMLTTEAFNALLKTLEEPPAHAILILATTEVHKIPATILSRCQRFDFRLATEAEIKSVLEGILKKEKVEAEDEALDLIIENAQGSFRDAISLLDVVISGQKESKNPKSISGEEVRVVLGLADSTMVYFFLEKLVDADGSAALELLEELAQKGVNLSQFVKFVLSVLREILVGGMKDKVDYGEYSFAKKLDRDKTLRLINLFVEAERALKDSVIPQLPLELLVAESLSIFGSNDGGVGGGEGGKPSSPKVSHNGDSNRKNSIGGDKAVAEDSSSASNKDEISSDKKVSLSLKDLESKWSAVLEGLKPYNSHLYAFMGRAKALELKDGVLKLAVGFEFHKDRMEDVKSKVAIAKVFNEVFGCPVKLQCVVDDSVRQSVTPAAEVVVIDDSAGLSTSGDKIVSKSSSGSSDNQNIYDSIAEIFGDDVEPANL